MSAVPVIDPALEQQAKELAATPVGFAVLVLGLPIYPWQSDVLSWYSQPEIKTMGALCTPNGAGKSSNVIAALALWYVAMHPKGRVVITTKDSKQLEEQLYPALERHKARFLGWNWVTSPYITITTGTGGKIIAFTTNDAGRAEGWHKGNDKESPLLMIVDEAKSVEENIFQAIDRCTYNGLLYASSPGLMQGTFYDAFGRNRGLFLRKQVSLDECPHKEPGALAIMEAKWGKDHPMVRSSWHGEFTDQDAATSFVFPLSVVNRALEDPPRARKGARCAFCDFAAGGDENVLALREGNTVRIVATWRDRDTMRAVARFATEFRKLGLKPEEIWGDDGGLGHPMMDALSRTGRVIDESEKLLNALGETGWAINRVNNGQAAYRKKVYMNRGAEIWHETAAAMQRSEILILDGDDELRAQLISRKAIWNASMKLGVESKEDMRLRGVSSPDRADALCGAWACGEVTLDPLATELDIWKQWEEQGGEELAEMAGMEAGS